jgi:hypothetical protein
MLNQERGAGLTEVLLAMGLVAATAPFVYFRVAETSRGIGDIALARQITATKSDIMNFIRLNQDAWDKTAEITLAGEDLGPILPKDVKNPPYVVFIEKYPLKHGSGFEAYAAFRPGGYDAARMARLAKALGADAGIVHEGKTAYGIFGDWGAASEQFAEGDLVYRIKTDFSEASAEKYLHRSASEGLNEMQRDFILSGRSIYDVAEISAKSLKSRELSALFANADRLAAGTVSFPNGATMDAAGAAFGNVRVNGDLTGFRNIYAKRLGASGTVSWSAQTDVVADRATITGAVHVGENLLLKSSAAKTISGFAGASVHSAFVPYLSATDLYFAPKFGITVSSELLYSYAQVPLKLGSWSFPSGTAAPKFTALELARADVDVPIDTGEFVKITGAGWKELPAANEQ